MRSKDSSKTESIFRATLHLVKEKGLAGTTMSDISKAAHLATGTLYIYFKSKEELIKALFAECRKDSAGYYFEGVSLLSRFEDRLERIFTNIIQYKTAYFEISVFLEQCYHSPYFCQAELHKKQEALQPLFSLIKEGKDKGLIKNIDDELLLSYMFGMINDIVKKSFFSQKRLTADTIRQLYSLFWDGLAARKS